MRLMQCLRRALPAPIFLFLIWLLIVAGSEFLRDPLAALSVMEGP